MSRASQFYTGLVAEVYDLLVARPPDAAQYADWIGEHGQPALELACGSGDPLLALRKQGLDVEGVDSSADMLERCRQRAAALGVTVVLHHQEMQRLELASRYRTIFLAGPSFMLLTTLDDATQALSRIHAHLEHGGRAVIPLFLPFRFPESKHAGRDFRAREPVRAPDGSTVRLSERFDYDRDAQLQRAMLRYEITRSDGRVDSVERAWLLRWYEQDEFRDLLRAAGFASIECVRGNRQPSAPSDPAFVFVATRT